MVSASGVVLKHISTHDCALSGDPRLAAIAPYDLLSALTSVQPDVGGALQQDVGEVRQHLRFGIVSGLVIGFVFARGVTLANLATPQSRMAIMYLHGV